MASQSQSQSQREQLRAKLAGIVDEMKRIGLWQSEPLAPEAFEFTNAFAQDTMAYSQWLQFVFVPRVIAVLDAQSPLPESSSVGAQAVREFDGQFEASELVRLLAEFDAVIEE